MVPPSSVLGWVFYFFSKCLLRNTLVDILLAHRDIDINATTRRGTSPLSLAASRGLTSIVAKLDVRGCWGEPGLVGVNHQGFGRTPLSWATNNGED